MSHCDSCVWGCCQFQSTFIYCGFYQMSTESTLNCYLKTENSNNMHGHWPTPLLTNTLYQSGSPRHSIHCKWWGNEKSVVECKKRTCLSCRPDHHQRHLHPIQCKWCEQMKNQRRGWRGTADAAIETVACLVGLLYTNGWITSPSLMSTLFSCTI